MKIIMVMVSTLNGKITNGSDQNIYSWTSKEDQKFFISLLEKNRVMVMGRNTYEAAKNKIKLHKNRLRIVLTRNLGKYANYIVHGQLEFSNESPNKLVNRLKKSGFKQLLVLGGGKVNASFLMAGLVDELYLTLEPRIFGIGKNIFEDGEFENTLHLLSLKKLNKKGTLLLKYRLLK